MLLSVALFQGFLGRFVSSWPLRLIGFSVCFGPSFSDFRLPSEPALEAVFRGEVLRRVHGLSEWQRVRDSNPCTGLERAVS